jgi:hypothetical protein
MNGPSRSLILKPSSAPSCWIWSSERCHGDTVPISATYAPLRYSSSVLHSPLLLLLLISFAHSPVFPRPTNCARPEITLFSAQSPQSQVLHYSLQLLLYLAPPVFPRARSSSSSFSNFSSLLLTFTPLKQILGPRVCGIFASHVTCQISPFGLGALIWGAFRLDGNKSLGRHGRMQILKARKSAWQRKWVVRKGRQALQRLNPTLQGRGCSKRKIPRVARRLPRNTFNSEALF